MRVLTWLLRAVVFFVLFAFALNNQHEVDLHWFFGLQTRAPMVFVVLGAFAAGAVLGVLAMLLPWWQQRRRASHLAARAPAMAEPAPPTRPAALADLDLSAARRDGI